MNGEWYVVVIQDWERFLLPYSCLCYRISLSGSLECLPLFMIYWIPAALVYSYWWVNGPDLGFGYARTPPNQICGFDFFSFVSIIIMIDL